MSHFMQKIFENANDRKVIANFNKKVSKPASEETREKYFKYSKIMDQYLAEHRDENYKN